jgi:pilus assembly protein CpaB
MFLRVLVLALGAVAVLVGGTLLMLALAPRPEVAEAPRKANQSILVAAKPLAAGSLLRADDLRWREIPADQVPPGSYQRGPANEPTLSGAALRRDFASGEPLIADQVVKPNEAGFPAAALAPGERAVTIAVDAAESNAGLVVPDDCVDVILTQSFNESEVQLSHRSASETVLSDLRVIGVDQTLSPRERKPDEGGVLQPTGDKTPKTVTLEVTVDQAQTLMLASHLGKLQLTLRGSGENRRPVPRAAEIPRPTWAYEVSSALRSLDRVVAGSRPDPSSPPPGPSGAAPERVGATSVEVIHGSKVEERCFDPQGRTLTTCSPRAITPERQPAAATPASGGAAAPTS